MTNRLQQTPDSTDNFIMWQKKPLLQKIYRQFHLLMARYLANNTSGAVVELGSGVPDTQEVIPHCIRTDLTAREGIDQTENAYTLSFKDGEVSNLLLFDVFHHLRYPGYALAEFSRVLGPGGRLLIFDPCVSLLALVVYGLFHAKPLSLKKEITLSPPPNWTPDATDYYAAQGNAFRLFVKQPMLNLEQFKLTAVCIRRIQVSHTCFQVATRGLNYTPLWHFPF